MRYFGVTLLWLQPSSLDIWSSTTGATDLPWPIVQTLYHTLNCACVIDLPFTESTLSTMSTWSKVAEELFKLHPPNAEPLTAQDQGVQNVPLTKVPYVLIQCLDTRKSHSGHLLGKGVHKQFTMTITKYFYNLDFKRTTNSKGPPPKKKNLPNQISWVIW